MSNEPDVIRINGLRICNGTSVTGALEPKTPFLIGVAGGTASGKVFEIITFSIYLFKFVIHLWHYHPMNVLTKYCYFPYMHNQSTVCKRIMEHLGQADMDHTQRQVKKIASFLLFSLKEIRAESFINRYQSLDSRLCLFLQ